MKYAFDLHHRRSIRLKGYDYSRPGAYFITICTQNRLCLFGQVVDGNMMLNDAGQMIQNTWDEIPRHYHGVDVDAFIVMPNHIHGVVIIVGATPCGCPDCSMQARGPIQGQARGPALRGELMGCRYRTWCTGSKH